MSYLVLVIWMSNARSVGESARSRSSRTSGVTQSSSAAS